MDTIIAAEYYKDRASYDRTAKAWTAKHACGDIKTILSSIAPISDKAAALLQQGANCPKVLLDPITNQLLDDPVLAPTSGITYSRAAIIGLLKTNGGICPKTGISLEASQLIPNIALKNEVDDFRTTLATAKMGEGWWNK